MKKSHAIFLMFCLILALTIGKAKATSGLGDPYFRANQRFFGAWTIYTGLQTVNVANGLNFNLSNQANNQIDFGSGNFFTLGGGVEIGGEPPTLWAAIDANLMTGNLQGLTEKSGHDGTFGGSITLKCGYKTGTHQIGLTPFMGIGYAIMKNTTTDLLIDPKTTAPGTSIIFVGPDRLNVSFVSQVFFARPGVRGLYDFGGWGLMAELFYNVPLLTLTNFSLDGRGYDTYSDYVTQKTSLKDESITLGYGASKNLLQENGSTYTGPPIKFSGIGLVVGFNFDF